MTKNLMLNICTPITFPNMYDIFVIFVIFVIKLIYLFLLENNQPNRIMAEILCINLTYKSPHEDVEDSIGLNPDGTVNCKFTLITLRNLLEKNLEVVKKLLENADNVTDIVPIGYGIVEAKINSESVKNSLFDDNVLLKASLDNSNDDFLDQIHYDDSNSETNEERFAMINNLTNQNDSQMIFNRENSDSEQTESGDEIIDDSKNAKLILEKYRDVITNNEDTSDSEKSGYDSMDDVLEDEEHNV